jgi:4-hydroxy-tetrahydrodipicolinate reductase
MTLRIGVAGILGRMGRLVAEEVVAAGQALAGGTTRRPDEKGPGDVPLFMEIGPLAAISDLVIDFSAAEMVQAHAAALRGAGRAWVLGTTGLTTADESAVAATAEHVPVIAAPNFSPGVNLLFALARQLAAALPAETYDAEILEMHHRQKLDAPSGTALRLGRAVAAGRGQVLADVMVSGRHGKMAARQDGEIGFATLRGGQIFGSHSVLMTSADEQITLTHHAFNRRIFAAGAVRAALWLADKPPGFYTMAQVLGLEA